MPTHRAHPPFLLPTLALLANAFIWGLSWWPFRAMQAAGLHPLWATALMYALMLAGLAMVRPGALRAMAATPALWLLAISSGVNNVAFNWAVTVGDVVRVVLLFFLMPAWATLLAWWLLGERPTPAAALRLVLAFAGVALVLVPAGSTWATLVQGLSVADALALLGGCTFALTSVLLRRLHTVAPSQRMGAMFIGCTLLGLAGALAGGAVQVVPPLPAPSLAWVLPCVGLALALTCGNWAYQYGAARLASGTAALVMLSEVVFASVSSILIAGEILTPRTVAGGLLIVLAAALATMGAKPSGANSSPAP